ncbi:MAG: hypothetical protein AMXMBFR53_11280 [Gemmatimonadota bacterium]
MVVEHPEGRRALQELEALGEGADPEARARRDPPLPPQDLLQSLELAVVVAQQQRLVSPGGAHAQVLLQAAHVPLDGRRGGGVEAAERGALVGEVQPREGVQEPAQGVGLEEEGGGRSRGGPRVHQVVEQGVDPLPRAGRVGGHVPAAEDRHHGIAGEELEEGTGHRPAGHGPLPEVHGEDVGLADLVHGALVQDLEGADGHHLVPPELDAHGVAGAHGEHVHDAPPDGELPHLLHQGDALEAPLLEDGRQVVEVHGVAHPHGEAEVVQGGGNGYPLLKGTGRRDQDLRPARKDPLHRLHPEGADLQVRLHLFVGQGLFLGVETGVARPPEERLQIRLRRGGFPRPGGEHHEHALGVTAVEGRHHRHRRRSSKARQGIALPRSREPGRQLLERGTRGHRRQDGVRPRHAPCPGPGARGTREAGVRRPPRPLPGGG